MSTLTILCIGDVVGKPGRQVMSTYFPKIKAENKADFVVVNAENSAGGFGFNKKSINQLTQAGGSAFTMGNHTFAKRDTVKIFNQFETVIRPINLPASTPGVGYRIFEVDDQKIGVISALGRVFMHPVDCPFTAVEKAVKEIRKETPIIVVDFHTEATSEIQALSWFLDGKVSAVFGTHTHVQTADERCLPGGTAAISDIGMCGSQAGIIGMEKDPIIGQFLNHLPIRKEPSNQPPFILNGIRIIVEKATGLTKEIQRLNYTYNDHLGGQR